MSEEIREDIRAEGGASRTDGGRARVGNGGGSRVGPRYGTVARLFHWLTAAAVFVMIPVGIMMTSGGFSGIEDPLFILHKGLGSVILVVVVLRILWRLGHRPPELPDTMPALEKWMAKSTHWLLYGLLLVQTVSGYLRTVADDFPIELLEALGIPPLLSGQPGLAQAMLVVHIFSAYTLAAVISAHAAAAVYHALNKKDGIFHRIWPPIG